MGRPVVTSDPQKVPNLFSKNELIAARLKNA